MVSQSLQALHRLQAVETKLRGFKEQLRRKERQFSQYSLRIGQSEEQINARHEEIKHRKTQTAKLELDFKTIESDIAKLRTQLNSAKNNKEYSAILTQLNTERADNSKLEQKILEELTEIDKLKASLTEMEETQAKQKAELASHESDSKSQIDELKSQIAELESQKQIVAQEVPQNDLKQFTRVADANDGEAMAKIIEPSRGSMDYICDGCNMSLPVEKINALKTRDELQVCPVCGRILYIQNETKDTAAK
jgi:predicted  nucleic acid-binding Zn-ribbon protein